MKIFLSLICFLLLTACQGSSTKPANAAETETKEDAAAAIKTEGATVMVYTSAGAVQCEFNGHPPKFTAQKLIQNDIEVIHSTCGQITGMMNAAVCGGGTARINLHQIPAEAATRAESLGYQNAKTLVNKERGMGYEKIKCP